MGGQIEYEGGTLDIDQSALKKIRAGEEKRRTNI